MEKAFLPFSNYMTDREFTKRKEAKLGPWMVPWSWRGPMGGRFCNGALK